MNPFEGFAGVSRYAQAAKIHFAEGILRPGDTLLRSALEQFHGGIEIPFKPQAKQVRKTQIVLGEFVTFFGRLFPPFESRLSVFLDASYFIIHVAQIELRPGITLFGEAAPIAQSGGEITLLIGLPPVLEIGQGGIASQDQCDGNQRCGETRFYRCRHPHNIHSFA